MIVEDPVRGVVVPDLREINLETIEELKDLIDIGSMNRTMAPT